MKQYIVSLPNDWNAESCKNGECQDCGLDKLDACPLKNAIEVSPVDVPEGHMFSAVFERNGVKSDWESVELWAAPKRPQ